jgi:hypothetical protein
MEEKAGDHIKIEGLIEIRNGDKVITGKNHIVGQGLKHIINLMICTGTRNAYENFNKNSYYYNARIGSDISNTTTVGATALSADFGSNPNSKAISASNISTTIFDLNVTATWNAGTVTGTLGEVGILWGMLSGGVLKTAQFTSDSTQDPLSTQLLFSRMSAGDGDFSAFTIDNTKPLTVSWTLRLTFA